MDKSTYKNLLEEALLELRQGDDLGAMGRLITLDQQAPLFGHASYHIALYFHKAKDYQQAYPRFLKAATAKYPHPNAPKALEWIETNVPQFTTAPHDPFADSSMSAAPQYAMQAPQNQEITIKDESFFGRRRLRILTFIVGIVVAIATFMIANSMGSGDMMGMMIAISVISGTLGLGAISPRGCAALLALPIFSSFALILFGNFDYILSGTLLVFVSGWMAFLHISEG